MNVLFLIPDTFSSYPGATVPHLGVAYLIAVLKRAGIRAHVMDIGLRHSDSHLIKLVKSIKFDLIGVTAYSIGFRRTSKLIDLLRAHTDSPIVLGGSHVSAFRKEVFHQAQVDFAIKGEGERPLLELCNELSKNNREIPNIRGLIWKHGNRIIENADSPYLTNLDALPYPAFDSFELSKYVFFAEKRIPIATSRGCPYRCIYCAVRLSMGRIFRPRSPKNVVDEIEHWYDRGWRYFDLVDDCFTLDIERAAEICDRLNEKNLRISWSLGNGIRLDKINEKLLRRMKRAGCVFLCYGLESGDNEVLEKIKKGVTTEQAEEVFRLTRQIGITFAVNFIIGHPGETYNKALKTIDFARRIPANYVNFYNLIPYPYTELYNWIMRNGRFIENYKDYLESVATRIRKPVFDTDDFPVEDRFRALKQGFCLAKRSHLSCRLGSFAGTVLAPIANSDALYFLGRKAVFGSAFGRKLFNLIKR
jgi:anaerobic magnesium-protoporphyrin IX monomethyl ester cyclase